MGLMTINYKGIILFDGVCHFCQGSVQFIIKRDDKAYFHFASLQSEIGQKLVGEFGVPNNINSVVLLENERFYTKSAAALRICGHLNRFWPIFKIFMIFPAPLRDFFYDFIAKNRYKWFGKSDACMLPSPAIRKRFLE
jgi:predicted DCC family thiol-disulfide oxidoreductase YuxK